MSKPVDFTPTSNTALTLVALEQVLHRVERGELTAAKSDLRDLIKAVGILEAADENAYSILAQWE